MAVLQGARLRTGAMPTPGPATRGVQPAGSRARVALPAALPHATRVRPTGLLMAGIVAATLVGMVYLTPTLGSNATDSRIVALEADYDDLQQEISRDAIRIDLFADTEAVKTAARKLGLTRLGGSVVLTVP